MHDADKFSICLWHWLMVTSALDDALQMLKSVLTIQELFSPTIRTRDSIHHSQIDIQKVNLRFNYAQLIFIVGISFSA